MSNKLIALENNNVVIAHVWFVKFATEFDLTFTKH